MLYQLILTVTLFFTLLFLFLFFRTFNWNKIKQHWNLAVKQSDKLKIVKEAMSKGYKSFFNDTIYAKNKKDANILFQKELLKSQGKTRKTKKTKHNASVL
jgi:hypothetical protein